MTLTFGSLFTGIGGFDLGLEAAGLECRWQVEIDEFCAAVLDSRFPGVPRHRDVREVSGRSLEAVDAICGGFPCQPVSLAGRRQGASDERWLWPEFARLVGELRPSYVIVENVPGVYSAGGAEIVADLAEMRYQFWWGSLSAAALGAPHRRERFFLLAHAPSSGDQPLTGEAHGDEETDARGSAQHDHIAPGLGPFGRAGSFPRAVARSFGRTRRDYARWWADDPAHSQPGLGRMVDGVPHRVERLRALGNALSPAQAEVLGRLVMCHAGKEPLGW